MRIEKLFKKDIFRPINGVVKAQQLDDTSRWQELDEFVLTSEMVKHLRMFIDRYNMSLDHPNSPEASERMGVWISGFFGSGKSHLIKILSYLFQNIELTHEGQKRRAIDFFDSKVSDALLLGDIKRAVTSQAEVILFNIDVKADANAGRDAILRVFLKSLNEAQGFCPEHPHIAHMERYLQYKGKLVLFEEIYRRETGSEWRDERDAYDFNRDQVVVALRETLGQSQESCEKWIDGAESNFSLTVENFSKWTREFLDSKGPKHRILFLVDEVGQFIGSDTHLMLSLQTITEQLGSECLGRAWVVVTSQEDIDAVLGDIRSTKSHDFSKIQGRFRTRLSLSSANVDEVITERLLSKVDGVVDDLKRRYEEQGDILRHQITFTQTGMTFRKYKGADDFAAIYPFTPYQFLLVQKIFEAIRKAGATGLHLSRGERSVLDAFQAAGKAVANKEVGVLVPLYLFYPSIESFLDTAVKRTIDQAYDNPSLKPFDIEILKVLFLIRYVEEMKGNIDNLVTLCLDEIDADRLHLKRGIEDSLMRLEKETLISRNGDNFFFLTNEERDINREIKAVELSGGEEARWLGELIFNERGTFNEQRKHRFEANKMDFAFNRVCDGFPIGNRIEGALTFQVITPLHDEYDLYQSQRCVLESNDNDGQVILRLQDDRRLVSELRTSLQTEKYLRNKGDSALPSTTKRIHRDLADENRQRRERLVMVLQDLLISAEAFAAGQQLQTKATSSGALLEELMDYLVRNTFKKMAYIQRVMDNPLPEIQAILRANDVQQQSLEIQTEQCNPLALEDLRQYIDLCHRTSRQIVMFDLVNERYGLRPYGWPQMEVSLLLARLLVLGEAQLQMDGAPVILDRCYDLLTTPGKWRKVVVRLRKTSDPAALQKARQIGKDVFSIMGPDGEEPLVNFLKDRLGEWQAELQGYKTLADTGDYPGRQEIDSSLATVGGLLKGEDPGKFIERFNAQRSDLLDLSDTFHDLKAFYTQQKPIWEQLRKAYGKFQLNQLELDRHETAAPALRRMREILQAPHPYEMIKEAGDLIQRVDAVNSQLVDQAREAASKAVDQHSSALEVEINTAAVDPAVKGRLMSRLEALKSRIESQESLAHLRQISFQAQEEFDHAVNQLEERDHKQPKGGNPDLDPISARETPIPKIRKRRVIHPSELVSNIYLETEADVQEFLDALRVQLEEAIRNEERIQIR